MDIAIFFLRIFLVLILGSGVILLAGMAGMSAETDRAECRRLTALAFLGVIGAAVVAVFPL